MHLEIGKCNSNELFSIIENENPEIIFEEFDIDRINDEYYKNGHYKYQNGSTVETFAVMNYLERNKIVYIPVDTHDVTYFPGAMYKKISKANEEYTELFKRNIILASEQGFPYLNSIECCDLMEKMHSIEVEVINKSNDKKLVEDYREWQLITENRDNEMLKNIYNYSRNNNFNNAIFIIGAEHKKTILDKIKNNNDLTMNWQLLKF